MATRAQICIKRDTEGFAQTGGIYIYKHNDGYPSDVMDVLAPTVKEFIAKRGNDAPYLLAYMAKRGNDAPYLLAYIMRKFASRDDRDDNLEVTGWGLDTEEHGDIDYLYQVDSVTGEVLVNGKLYISEATNE
jgi:hypothetical protein